MNFFTRKPKLDINRFDSVIASNMAIEGGVITYSGSLKVDGNVNASIAIATGEKVSSQVIVGETGSITTETLIADFVVVRGRILGNVSALEQLIIEKTGQIQGNVRYGKLRIDAGGSLHGSATDLTKGSPVLVQLETLCEDIRRSAETTVTQPTVVSE